MRYIFTIFLLFCIVKLNANPFLYERLTTLNECWKEQQDIDLSAVKGNENLSEQGWIRLHLSLVEKTLRDRNTNCLTPKQRQNRLFALDQLHEYMVAGNFPQNEDYNYRTPIFIDKHDNFCAVGYLVKATGYEQVSRMIAAKTNLAYVGEMNYPELFSWANSYGFTVDELAWIQPSYFIAPDRTSAPIGDGTKWGGDGAVC